MSVGSGHERVALARAVHLLVTEQGGQGQVAREGLVGLGGRARVDPRQDSLDLCAAGKARSAHCSSGSTPVAKAGARDSLSYGQILSPNSAALSRMSCESTNGFASYASTPFLSPCRPGTCLPPLAVVACSAGLPVDVVGLVGCGGEPAGFSLVEAVGMEDAGLDVTTCVIVLEKNPGVFCVEEEGRKSRSQQLVTRASEG